MIKLFLKTKKLNQHPGIFFVFLLKIQLNNYITLKINKKLTCIQCRFHLFIIFLLLLSS